MPIFQIIAILVALPGATVAIVDIVKRLRNR